MYPLQMELLLIMLSGLGSYGLFLSCWFALTRTTKLSNYMNSF